MKNIFKNKKSILVPILIIALLICSSVILTACNNNQDDTKSDLPVYEPGSIALVPQDQDYHDFERPYRLQYYGNSVYYLSEILLDEEQKEDYYDWSDKYYKDTKYFEDLEEMYVVTFIKRYNIAREDFEKAVEVVSKKNEQRDDFYASDGRINEEYEPLNVDIIYTFDEEIIREYYRYE